MASSEHKEASQQQQHEQHEKSAHQPRTAPIAPSNVNMLFPDNQNRGRRVEQLANDIGFVQNNITRYYNDMDNRDVRMRPLLDRIMREHGLTSFTELRDRIYALLTTEQRQELEDLLAANRESNNALENAFSGIMLFTLISGGLQTVGRGVVFYRGMALTMNSRTLITAFTYAIRGNYALAARMLGPITRTLATSMNTWTRAGNLGAFVRIATKVTTVIAVVGVVFSAILVIIAAIQGAQQRTALQQKIRELFAYRVQAFFYEEQARPATQQQVAVENYFRDYDDPTLTQEERDFWLPRQADRIADNIIAAQEVVTFEHVMRESTGPDRTRPTSWTNEDPVIRSLEELEALIDSFATNSHRIYTELCGEFKGKEIKAQLQLAGVKFPDDTPAHHEDKPAHH